MDEFVLNILYFVKWVVILLYFIYLVFRDGGNGDNLDVDQIFVFYWEYVGVIILV